MRIGAVLTGDIIHSTCLEGDDRGRMIDALNSLRKIVSPFKDYRFELFRGDSFQMCMSVPTESLKAAILIRSYLRSQNLNLRSFFLDARIAIGIGNMDYVSDSLATSDGEAFRLSGRCLDEMTTSRLKISTPWSEINEELAVSTAFADQIISSWTRIQSKIVFSRIFTSDSQTELSQKLGISQQMISKSLKTANANLIVAYTDRFENLINRKASEL